MPICWKPGVEGGVQVQAAGPDECDRAVIGKVEAKVLFAYPENSAISVPGKGKVYNAGVRGRGTNLLLEIPLSMPYSGTFWLVAKVRPTPGGGDEVTIRVPTLADGYGTLTGLHLELGRNFGHDGERVGYVQARCDGGKLTASDTTRLTDGTENTSEVVRTCGRRPG